MIVVDYYWVILGLVALFFTACLRVITLTALQVCSYLVSTTTVLFVRGRQYSRQQL